MEFEKVTHVIFDMDGTLLDTETSYCKIFASIAAQYNKEYPWNIRIKLMGTPERESARIMVEELGLPISVDEFLLQQQKAVSKLLPHVHLMPGVSKVVHHLHKNNIPIAIATSSGEESVAIKTSHHKQLMSLFSHVVASSSDPEVKHGKPAPDVYLICASRFAQKPKPEMCLVIEDAPNGVKAARAAGMQVVMVPEEQLAEELKKEATLVIPSLEAFKPELFGLPPF